MSIKVQSGLNLDTRDLTEKLSPSDSNVEGEKGLPLDLVVCFLNSAPFKTLKAGRSLVVDESPSVLCEH